MQFKVPTPCRCFTYAVQFNPFNHAVRQVLVSSNIQLQKLKPRTVQEHTRVHSASKRKVDQASLLVFLSQGRH